MNTLTQHSIDSGVERSAHHMGDMNKGGSLSSNLSYLLIGGGIGAGLALLFAPKAGSELRGDISDYAHRGYDGTLDMAHKMMDQSRDLYTSLKDKADQFTGGAASRLEDKVMDKVSDLSNGGSELLEGITDGGREQGSARGTN